MHICSNQVYEFDTEGNFLNKTWGGPNKPNSTPFRRHFDAILTPSKCVLRSFNAIFMRFNAILPPFDRHFNAIVPPCRAQQDQRT